MMFVNNVVLLFLVALLCCATALQAADASNTAKQISVTTDHEEGRELVPIAAHFIVRKACPVVSLFFGPLCGFWNMVDFSDLFLNGQLLNDDFNDKEYARVDILSDVNQDSSAYSSWTSQSSISGGSFSYVYSGNVEASASWRFEWEYGGNILGEGYYLKDITVYVTQQANFDPVFSSWEMEGTDVSVVAEGIENIDGVPVAFVTLDIILEVDEEIWFGPDQFLYWNCRVTIRGDGSYQFFAGTGNVPSSNSNACSTAQVPRIVTRSPTSSPTRSPTTPMPTTSPTTSMPSKNPTFSPSVSPSKGPSVAPSSEPTKNPSKSPTTSPSTSMPTRGPTFSPSSSPTKIPSSSPSTSPTTSRPTTSPTTSMPSKTPSRSPSNSPTTASPSTIPTYSPTRSPSVKPPSPSPTSIPTPAPGSTTSSISGGIQNVGWTSFKCAFLACLSLLVLFA